MAVMVIGMGLMGRGIAGALVTVAQLPVVVVDNSPKAMVEADAYILKQLKRRGNGATSIEKYVKKFHKLTEAFEKEKIDFVIEAVPENIELKSKIFQDLEKLAEWSIVLATNTSSLPITLISERLEHPQRVIGMHFFNPVNKMRGLEVIPTKYTSESVLEQTLSLGRSMGKVVSVCRVDIAGFLVNRVLNSNLLEALSLLERKAATPREIDNIMVACTNAPMGPFQLTDFVGLDTAAAIAHIIFEDSNRDPKYAPSKLLDKMVQEGKLGTKSGEGFYKYESKL